MGLIYKPNIQAIDANGDPYSGAKLYVYDATTTDDQETFSDSALTTPNANPLIADSAGIFGPLYLGTTGKNYKISVDTSADVNIPSLSQDNISPSADPSINTVKTASTSRASTTTLADDTHLLGIALEAAAIYRIEACLLYSQNVGDFKFTFQFSNAQQTNSRAVWHASDSAGTRASDVVTVTDTNTISTLLDGGNMGIDLRGSFQANASIGGTLDLQWAQGTSSANNTTLFAHSWIRLTKIG